MSEERNWSPELGNPADWSTKGWTAEWRRIGIEWWQFRIFDPKGEIRTNGWVDFNNSFYTNMLGEIKRTIQHYASVDAQNIAAIRKMSFDEIVNEYEVR